MLPGGTEAPVQVNVGGIFTTADPDGHRFRRLSLN
jgi:hypothetical protein